MFFARKSCFSKKSLYNFFLSSFSTNSNVIPIKVRYSKSDYTNLVLALPYQNQKIFFINDKFTFNSLKEIFLLESPLSKINITYPVSLPLKGESNLLKYLKAKEIGEVNFSIDNNEYSLTNDASFLMNQIVEKVVKDSQNNKNSVLYWYNFCIQNKIPYTNTGTLAYFMRILNHHLEIYGMTNEIKNSDIEILFKKVLNEFSCPINQKLENLLEKNNELDSEIVQLEKDKENIEEIAKKRIIFYQKLIILMSLAQILSFYYMIFHVDWLGWDIIEPITYTISQLTLLFGIRFFFKYGKKRDLATMQEIVMKRVISRSRDMKIKYTALNENLLDRRIEKQKLQWQMDLLKNQRTYSQFMKS